MHTKGEIEVHAEEDGLHFLMQKDPPEGFTGIAIACYLTKEDAEHIAALWNAANGMTTKQVVKYIEHGREMERTFIYWGNNLPDTYPIEAIISRAKDIANKLGGE